MHLGYKGMRHSIGMLAVAAVAAAGVTASANAALVQYTDRASWLAAIGSSTGGEDFEGFGADTSFDSTSVALSDGMSISTLSSTGSTSYNKIDVLPVDSGETDTGSNNARIFNGSSGAGVTPAIDFANPISAFGADFMNLNDSGLRTEVSLSDSVGAFLDLLTPPVGGIGELRFWGFAATAGESISRLEFTRLDNDVFGLDNIEIKDANPVPVPAALPLLAAGIAGLGLMARRRKS